MEEKKELFIKKLRDNIYLLDEAHEATGYLLIGNEKAAFIDTMLGYNDLAKAAAELTDKPVIVINTHGHPDHVLGNVYFDKAYMNPVDNELADSFLKTPDTEAWLAERNVVFPPFEPMKDGDGFDLGGITLKAVALPGHTKGSVLLLCPEERVLFTGDSINHHLWMQLDHCLSVEEMADNLEKLLYLEKEADFILHGHAREWDDISLISALLTGARKLVAGETKDDTVYNWFDGQAMYHPFEVCEGKQYSMEDHGICYDPANVKKQ